MPKPEPKEPLLKVAHRAYAKPEFLAALLDDTTKALEDAGITLNPDDRKILEHGLHGGTLQIQFDYVKVLNDLHKRGVQLDDDWGSGWQNMWQASSPLK